jgi:hypothetical protein
MRDDGHDTPTPRRTQAQLLKQFRNALNSRGEDVPRRLSRLRKAGCDDEEELSKGLFAAVVASRANKGPLVDLNKISKGVLQGLSRDLQSVAGVVERVNESLFSP